MAKPKKTTIKLDPMDAAFIIKEDMGMEAVIPKFDEAAPDNVLLVTGVMILLSQEETHDILMEMISEALEIARANVEDEPEGNEGC